MNINRYWRRHSDMTAQDVRNSFGMSKHNGQRTGLSKKNAARTAKNTKRIRKHARHNKVNS